jgi:hypothetical protein
VQLQWFLGMLMYGTLEGLDTWYHWKIKSVRMIASVLTLVHPCTVLCTSRAPPELVTTKIDTAAARTMLLWRRLVRLCVCVYLMCEWWLVYVSMNVWVWCTRVCICGCVLDVWRMNGVWMYGYMYWWEKCMYGWMYVLMCEWWQVYGCMNVCMDLRMMTSACIDGCMYSCVNDDKCMYRWMCVLICEWWLVYVVIPWLSERWLVHVCMDVCIDVWMMTSVDIDTVTK